MDYGPIRGQYLPVQDTCHHYDFLTTGDYLPDDSGLSAPPSARRLAWGKQTESGHQVTETAEEEDQEEECHDLDEEENDIVSWCWDPLAPPDQWNASIKSIDQSEASIKSID